MVCELGIMSTRRCQHLVSLVWTTTAATTTQLHPAFTTTCMALYLLGGWVAPRKANPHAGRVKRNVGELSERHRSAVQCIQPEDGLNVARLHHSPGASTCSVDAGSCIVQDGRSLFYFFFFFLSVPLTPNFLHGCAALPTGLLPCCVGWETGVGHDHCVNSVQL